jgi:hypothetical protein
VLRIAQVLGYRLADLAWLLPWELVAMCEKPEDESAGDLSQDSHFTI